MFLSQRSYLKIVFETASDKSSSRYQFQFSVPPEALCILLPRPACQEDFCSNISCAHPHFCMHVRVRMRVCALSYRQRAENRALLAAEKMLGTVRAQPMQSENYRLTYEN